jgi:hypothetical protein
MRRGFPTNFQFLGNNHGNETLVAQQWLVDGVASTPTSGVLRDRAGGQAAS